MKVPMVDLLSEHGGIEDDLVLAFREVLRSGTYILGASVRTFESEMATYLGVSHCVGVNSGTDALVIGLRSLDIGPGDEVITTPFTFFATAEAISIVGASPVLVDIDPGTLNIDPSRILDAITPRTRAIVPVHLFGLPVEMSAIAELARTHDLRIIEDAAQALGAQVGSKKVGSLGDVAALSFFPSKTLGGFGDGGMIVTDDHGIAERSRALRAHGAKTKYCNEEFGYNSRLDELQAALLRVKLPLLDSVNKRRMIAATYYQSAFEAVPGLQLPPLEGPGWGRVVHQYTLRILGGRRDRVRDELDRAGISSMVYYPTPIHLLPVFRGVSGSFPSAEAAAAEVLSLPLWPDMPEATQDRITRTVRQCILT